MNTFFTIGFTQKNAKKFFELLKMNNISRVVDIRINNSSQLAGFAKGDDLEYFLKTVADIDYVYMPELAPTKELLKEYRDKKATWADYETKYIALLKNRNIADGVRIEDFNNNCFLCSEHLAQQCHRRLLVEFLKDHNKEKEITIKHLI
jgi:uncharacterized protein (DUF488 family)